MKNPDVEVVEFCDADLARAKQMAETYGAKAQAFAESEKLFQALELDTVFFCLPPFGHGAELQAVERARGGVSLNVYSSGFTVLFAGWEHSLTVMRENKAVEKIPGEPTSSSRMIARS